MSSIRDTEVLADTVIRYPAALWVVERFGIPFGFGDKTIGEIADEHGIPRELFLTVLNMSIDEQYTPSIFEHFDCLPYLLNYLRNSHSYFTEEQIPQLKAEFQRFIRESNDESTRIISQIFEHYISEVVTHTNYENDVVFDYIEQLYRSYLNGHDLDKNIAYRIGIYGAHHDDIETVLMDLLNILLRHLPEGKNTRVRRDLILHLLHLQQDLSVHSRLENELLIPTVHRLERTMNLV